MSACSDRTPPELSDIGRYPVAALRFALALVEMPANPNLRVWTGSHPFYSARIRIVRAL